MEITELCLASISIPPLGSVFRDFEEHTPAAKGGYRNYFERLRLILTHHVAEVPEELRRFFVDVASKQEHDLKIAMDY